jgi:hypothetical protein
MASAQPLPPEPVDITPPVPAPDAPPVDDVLASMFACCPAPPPEPPAPLVVALFVQVGAASTAQPMPNTASRA